MVTINITQEMKDRAYDFSASIIMQNNQYDRMRPQNVLKPTERTTIRINRTYVGKLAELCFNEYLAENKIFLKNDGMFEIFEGQENVDDFDFRLPNGETIDIKAAVFSNHHNLVVPIDQFERTPKSYYVGIKFDCPINSNDYRLIDKETFTKATIRGFCTYDDLKKRRTINLGEFDCKAMPLNSLNSITELIAMF